jgi:succinoglycan biosynthesis protein ExoM
MPSTTISCVVDRQPRTYVDRDKGRRDIAMSEHSVAICVCTRRRPKMLRACLDSLIAQTPPEGWAIALIVVENDDNPCCANIVADFQKRAPYLIEYFNETEVGIPFARNAAIESVQALGSEWIAFIDDDELAEPDWLLRLCGRSEQAGVDAVQGAARYEYPSQSPDWLPHRALASRESGQILRTASTNNVMFRRTLTEDDGLGLRFDPRFRFTGGSDSDFFSRATENGACIVWEQLAVVSEIVPHSRLRLGWQLKRAFRVATNASEGELRRRGFMRALLRRMPKNVVRLITGTALLPLTLLWPLGAPLRRIAFSGMKRLASGLGGLAGLTSFRLEPYRLTDGH